MPTHLVDSNVWVALAVSPHKHHDAAERWLAAVEHPASVLFCRATQQSLLRLLTSAAVLAAHGGTALTNREAWAVVDELLADDRIVLRTDEPAGLDRLWMNFAVRKSASPKLWMDAYLAAFAVAGGLQLITADAAFRQFHGLDVRVLG